MITGDELRDAREISASMTQRELADLLGVSQRTVVNWEAAEVPPKRERRVMTLFGQHIESIRRGQEGWEAHTQWLDSDEGKAHLEEQGRDYEDQLQMDTDPIGYGLENASNDRLIEELRRRLSTRQAPMSLDRYTLAASDADLDAEVESQQEDP